MYVVNPNQRVRCGAMVDVTLETLSLGAPHSNVCSMFLPSVCGVCMVTFPLLDTINISDTVQASLCHCTCTKLTNSSYMNFNVSTICKQYGSHSVCTLWMYQDCVLYLAWWWFLWTETCRQIFNIDHCIYCCVIDWNKLLYYCCESLKSHRYVQPAWVKGHRWIEGNKSLELRKHLGGELICHERVMLFIMMYSTVSCCSVGMLVQCCGTC